MRNLKKLLALTLAMVMAFSLMLTANAAVKYEDFGDKDQITEEFKEAVQVLSGLEILQGDEKDGVKGFRPADTITRAEAAAIIYRIATQDVTGTQERLYSDYGTFVDVNHDDWFAGYVGYCQNAGYIKGTTPTTFNPYGKVTGYEMLAMILRVVGYGKNDEFTGSTWQVNVASLSKELGVINKVKSANFEHTLTMAARRDVVASLMFETMVKVPTVTYTPALGYSDKGNLLYNGKNPTLGQKNFGLFVDPAGWQAVDKWGTPGYYWVKGGKHNGSYDSTTWLPIYRATVVSNPSATGYNVIATVKPAATKTYDTAGIHECDVAHDLGFGTSENFKLFVNRNTPITDKYLVVATDTVTRVGGQGRETNFWYDVTSEYAGDLDPWCTMVDTYLATVTNVTERVVDPAGHEIVPSYLYLDVYDGQAVGASDKTDYYEPSSATDKVTRNTSEHRASKTGSNWEYAKGDKVLIKGYTDYTQNDAYQDAGTTTTSTTPTAAYIDNGSGLNHIDPVTYGTNSVEANNKAAFETNRLRPAGTNYANDASSAAAAVATKIDVVQKAEYKTGKQTVTYWNQGKHTVDGTDYNDQMTLFLDVAGTTTGTTFAWYFDTKGNLIGIDNVPNTVNYGVITSIYSAFNQGESQTDGTAKAIANVLYADGTTDTLTIDRFLLTNAVTNGGHGAVNTQMVDPGKGHTVGVGNNVLNKAGVVELLPVYDNSTGNVMAASVRGDATTKANNAQYAGWLHVAPVISVNAIEKGTNGQIGGVGPYYYGILKGNMFKFVTSVDGNMTAIEVAGKKDSANHAANENNGVFEWNYNATPTAGKLYKNFSYIALNTGAQAGDIWMDSETQIMVKGSSGAVTCYTLATLPGDVDIKTNEIDWSDPDGDGRAEFVYVTGTIEGTITYGLFYYNGGAAQWNGVDKKGTMFGWLNGEPTTVTFNNENQFNTVKDSQAYKGHLFALQLTNGVVSNVMSNGAATQPYLLYDYAGSKNTDAKSLLAAGWAGVKTETYATGTAFGLGSVDSKYSNPYTATTEAVYYNDMATPATPSATGETQLTYDASRRSISLDGVETYFLTPNTKVVGLGMNVNQEAAILDYLNHSTHNDVTIVYENNGVKSVVEIYVATDPNVTPGDNTTRGSVLVENNLAMQLDGVTLKQVGGTLTYMTNGTAVSPAGDGTYTAKIEAQNVYTGDWEVVGTWTGVASDNTAGSAGDVRLVNLNVNGLSKSVTYRLTITVSIGNVTTVVMNNYPISAQ